MSNRRLPVGHKSFLCDLCASSAAGGDVFSYKKTKDIHHRDSENTEVFYLPSTGRRQLMVKNSNLGDCEINSNSDLTLYGYAVYSSWNLIPQIFEMIT